MICFFNGAWVDERDAHISPWDRGFLLGDGFFETIAIREGLPEFAEEHLDRLAATAHALSIALPCERDALRDVFVELPRRNAIATGRMRLTISRGTLGDDDNGMHAGWDDPRWRTTVVATVRTFDASPGEPLRLAIAPRRFAPDALAGRHKASSYIDRMAARDAARRAGADDALLLNTLGHVMETSVANVFATRGGALLTPSLESGCLPGVARGIVLEEARRLGIEVETQTFALDEFLRTDAVFVTNSILGIAPVRSVGQHEFAPDDRLMPALRAAFHTRAAASREALGH